MHLDVACHHTTLTPALKSAVEDKFAKLQNHMDKPLRADVVLSVDGNRQIAEATIHGVGHPLHAKIAVRDNMYAAIDKLSGVLNRQWRKIKTNRMRHSRGKIAGIGKEAELVLG